MAARRGKGQRDRAKERQWRRIMRHWRSSGLSVRDFCDWQALSEPNFYAWRRELAQRDREAAMATGSATAAGTGKATDQVALRFLVSYQCVSWPTARRSRRAEHLGRTASKSACPAACASWFFPDAIARCCGT